MAFNGNLMKVKFEERKIIDRSHPPVIATFSIDETATTLTGQGGITGESKILPRGAVMSVDSSGKLEHLTSGEFSAEEVVVTIDDIDTEKSTLVNVVVHGCVIKDQLYATNNALEITDSHVSQLRKSGIYIT